ncbi:MAG: S8 family serine peptidase, partial [Promethearchaeia archaeon]
YDLRVKYHKKTNKDPNISINSFSRFFPEFYIPEYKYFSGIANASKLLNYKVLNETGQGRVSNIISALGSVIQNRSANKIISVCLSLGNYEIDASAINLVIDEVVDNGIFVVIAAGNYGIDDFETINSLGKNKNAIVVGAINDKDQITSYSSMGKRIDSKIIKPDIVAPGGSKLNQYRTIVSADANSNLLTSGYGTSISAALVSAAINILMDAKWETWSNWESINKSKWTKIIKSVLLMTATETNQNREDDPDTEIIESQNRFSPPLYLEAINASSRSGLKDQQEGYGRLNIDAAVDALIKSISSEMEYNGYLSSSTSDPLGTHAFARNIILEENKQYLFNLTEIENDAIFDIYLFSNESTNYGEPILLESSRRTFGVNNFIYFTPRKNETSPILVLKAINGEGNFSLNISEVENNYDPLLKIPEISYNGNIKNTTVLSLSEREGDHPKNNNTLDRYKFYIEYFDNDSANVPPQQVIVSIQELSKNYTMNQINIADRNYTDGAIFASEEIELPNNLTYHYYFYIRDGEKESYFPIKGTHLSIRIENPLIIKNFPYDHCFNFGLDNWSLFGTGWNLLHQNEQHDNRSNIYGNNWEAVYFGSNYNYPINYTYQSIEMDEILNGSFLSPYFDLRDLEDNMNPILKIGFRCSINEDDVINLLININGSGWKSPPLKSYTDLENDWDLEEINLTEYKGNYVRFKFEAILDENTDLINYKGFMIDFISIVNKTNYESPHIYFNSTKNIQVKPDLEFQKVIFSINYFDNDNNYPEYVYIEIENTNYSMVNYFGNWNASSNISEDKGIIFIRSISLGIFSNYSFKFHISDGKYTISSKLYNQDNSLINFAQPSSLQYNIYQNLNPIGYLFNETLQDFYISGIPVQKENTAWLRGDNSWHIIKKLYNNYIYGGTANLFNSQERGYGRNWEAELITKPIEIKTDKKVYLEFLYEIDLEFQGENGGDKGVVSISRDYGDTWTILKNYDSNGEGTEKLDISNEIGDIIMIKFTLITDNNLGASAGYGWLLSDIYIGYNREGDHIKPSVVSISPLNGERVNSITQIKLNLTDNTAIDLSKFEIKVDGVLYQPKNLQFNETTGLLIFDWNTFDYSDGWHSLEIVVFDNNNNNQEIILNLKVDNLLIKLSNWLPWIILGIIVVLLMSIIYLYSRINNTSILNKIKEKIISKPTSKIDRGKNKILKEIKDLDTSYLKNPLTLYCKYCDSWFYSDNFDIICPSCGRDQIYVAYKCYNCGKWYFKEEPGEYYCEKCDETQLIRRDRKEMEEIIAREHKKVLKKFEVKKSKQQII